MRPRRIILVIVNLALLAASWPLGTELFFSEPPGHLAYKPISVSLSGFKDQHEQPDLPRLLFRSERPAPEYVTVPTDTGTTPNIRLLGVVITDERRVAIIERDGIAIRVASGDDIDGWQVTSIEPRRIRLEKSEQQLDVMLDVPNNTQ